jgi:glycosyltransferase involved in cell wall biosynthesis
MAEPRFTPKASSLKELKVACIMDAFTLLCFAPECRLLELTPEGCIGQVDRFSPDLLFVESAWLGKDDLWLRKVAHGSKELGALCEHCKKKKIPVVFWNKEDPGNTDAFLFAARSADFVFTTDMDCVLRYKHTVGHDRVYHMHFAAQPRMHNPMETFERLDRFCFAGAYYHRYKERARVFDAFVPVFESLRGFDVYDRNHGRARPEHRFPEKYDKYILGSLPPSEIDKAYKGYAFGVNMNSETQSQTMFARRVFELLASNTVVAGNYSRGVKNYFGDMTICTDDVRTLKTTLDKYCGSEESLRKYRLLGLREVMKSHLYEDRLDYVARKVFGKTMKNPLPKVGVIIKDGANRERLTRAFNAQTYENKELYVATDAKIRNANALPLGSSAGDADADLLAYFDERDYYGANYLTDLMLSTRYAHADGVGKSGHCVNAGGGVKTVGREYCHCAVNALSPRRALFKKSVFKNRTVGDFVGTEYLRGDFIALDEFNYCEGFSGNACPEVDDMKLADLGVPAAYAEEAAESVSAKDLPKPSVTLDADAANALFTQARAKAGLSAAKQGEGLRIRCELPAGKAEYLYFPTAYAMPEKRQYVSLCGKFENSAALATVFYDKKEQKITHFLSAANVPTEINADDGRLKGAATFRLALRFGGPGTHAYERTIIEENPSYLGNRIFLPRSEALVVTNQYPAPDNLYRNMFVHARMLLYKEYGLACDLLRVHPKAAFGCREFEGINVAEGTGSVLAAALKSRRVKTVCVHFLDREMWRALKPRLGEIRLIVWCHGSEIQPWWRREFNYADEKEKAEAMRLSDDRMALWRDVFKSAETANIHFVFVSRYFADEVMNDHDVRLIRGTFDVIHNAIDTDRFKYREKSAEDRKRILAVSPYSSAKYANDIKRDAILLLSKKPFFGELKFTVCGEGDDFDKHTESLRRFSNVKLINRFLTRDELADLHAGHGVFLTPTRWDSQGVSRDEARASGLVAVTNAVAAVPEFCADRVDAMLAPAESAEGIAAAVEELYLDPELFKRISREGARRVSETLSSGATVGREMAVGGGTRFEALPGNITRRTPTYSIIHNTIDTDLFNYAKKDSEQRKRVFACRPWSTRTYANDIGVCALLELSKRKEFADMRFHISGVGELFDELTEPLRKFSNVRLEKRHYTHEEIAALHKQYGVCLIPTRMDSQGVSRDEAMSSGLVPVTNAVAAIPEFCTDGEDSLLLPAEDFAGVAAALLRLYREPELFVRLSENAARRVRRQSGPDRTIGAEIGLIRAEYEGK